MYASLEPKMSYKTKGVLHEPIKTLRVNDGIIISVYKGSFSKFDILIKYRQKSKNGKWSRIRTPKHIHWTVDILMKMQSYKKLTKEFIDFFINIWNNTNPIETERRRQSIDLQSLLQLNKREIEKFKKLSKCGEYNVRFLILLAKLLMIQEKTNLADAYMFRNLLDSLKEGQNLFNILSKASHTGRKKR